MWGDSATTSPEIFGTASVSYSCVQGGWTGTGNISEDPMFASTSGNLGLLVGSPCIDAGNNSLLPVDWADLDNDGDVSEPLSMDMEGKHRVLDGDVDGSAIVDMGAYEYAGYPRLVDLGSRRAHSGAGVLEIELPLDGRFVDSGECRNGGPRELVFTFNEAVFAADGVADASEVGMSAGVVDTVAIIGNAMTVTIHDVPDVSWLRIVLSGLVDVDGNPLMGDTVYLRVLSGDVTGNATVNSFDLTGVRARLGQAASEANCYYDVTTNGAINSFDLTFVRARLGRSLPSTWP